MKTRLASTIGDKKALEIYFKLIEYTLAQTKEVNSVKNIFYSSFIQDNYSADFFYLQEGVDLGEKMMNAFEKCFNHGAEKVIIIGTDCAEIKSTTFDAAFEKLNEKDVVIGPAKDGGYYLLGMKKMHSNLFQNMNWSTDEVYQSTINKLDKQNVSYHSLPILTDIDNEEDLMTLPKDF